MNFILATEISWLEEGIQIPSHAVLTIDFEEKTLETMCGEKQRLFRLRQGLISDITCKRCRNEIL